MWQCICAPALCRISFKYPPLEFLRHEITQLNRIWVSFNIVLKREQPPHHLFGKFENADLCPFAEPVSGNKSLGLSHRCVLLLLLLNPPPLPITFSAAFTLTCLQNYRLGLRNWSSRRRGTCRLPSDVSLYIPFFPGLFHFICIVPSRPILSGICSDLPDLPTSTYIHNPYRMWSLTFCGRKIKVRLYILFKSP